MSYNSTHFIGLTARIRRSPYFKATIAAGVKGFTVYNHMLMPTYYESLIADYWKLMNGVTVWDVATERQVEITGPDAYRLMEFITPRDLARCAIGQCKYVLLCDENGGIVNDPVLLRLADDHFWLSLADSDVLLWLKGLTAGNDWEVSIAEPDVSPLAVQGPNSDDLLSKLFGDWVRNLRFFHFREYDWQGIPLVVARSGWSKQGGFELYLRDSQWGETLWNRIMEAGQEFDIAPAAPSAIERVESSLLSYGSDMTLKNNPLELPVAQFCQLDKPAEYMSRAALHRIRQEGVHQKLKGLILQGGQLPSNDEYWTVMKGSEKIGDVSSAAYSPRSRRNLAFAMLSMPFADDSQTVEVITPDGQRQAGVCELPFK